MTQKYQLMVVYCTLTVLQSHNLAGCPVIEELYMFIFFLSTLKGHFTLTYFLYVTFHISFLAYDPYR